MRLSQRQFEMVVTQAIAAIPKRFQRHLHNLAFLVEVEAPDLDLLGIYEGTPRTERNVRTSFQLPDRITIFQRPHERNSRTLRQLRKLVEETVWHEVAHYFGMNEAEVERAERRRARR